LITRNRKHDADNNNLLVVVSCDTKVIVEYNDQDPLNFFAWSVLQSKIVKLSSKIIFPKEVVTRSRLCAMYKEKDDEIISHIFFLVGSLGM